MTPAPSAPEDSPADPAPEPAAGPGEIVAWPALKYRLLRVAIFGGMMMGFGSLFIRDGFFTWPAERREAAVLELEGKVPPQKPHTEADILIQRAIAVTVPPAGLIFLALTLYQTRGRYRLAGDTLHVPGHPPIPLEAVTQVDKTRWEKGITYVDYQFPDSPESRRVKLDAIAYQQDPTDEIVERIEAALQPAGEGEAEGAASSGGGLSERGESPAGPEPS